MSSHVTKQWKDLGDKLEKTIAIMGRNRSILLSVFTCAALATCIPAVAGPAHIAKHNTRHLNPAHTRNGMQKLSNSTEGDVTTFEDPVVRQAAIQALGRYDGSVVAIDPNSGRILSIVN